MGNSQNTTRITTHSEHHHLYFVITDNQGNELGRHAIQHPDDLNHYLHYFPDLILLPKKPLLDDLSQTTQVLLLATAKIQGLLDPIINSITHQTE